MRKQISAKESKYSKQDRGNLSAYEEYFAGMDASMQQKIALTTAHFPLRGRIADMGSGSGSGTFDLARLYQNLEVVGVDINPVTIEYSNKHFHALNLKYVTGDISERVFPENSLDGILNSSVLHHVTSFNDYDIRQIGKTLDNQVKQLKKGGVLIIRDFVVPDNAEKTVFIDLPSDDGKATDEISELSTAALFEVFARDFRSSLNRDKSFSYQKLASPRNDFVRFRVSLKFAGEFVLRKDYRDHWAPELIEEYTYFSQTDFENAFRARDLRIIVSMPLWNPWIVENRFAGKFHLSDLQENPLPFPPTNYLIVGEKVSENSGVQIVGTKKTGRTEFLQIKNYRHKQNGQVYELAMRPNRTIDLLPWFETKNKQIFILAKKDFPRPIINAGENRENLNRANYSGYLTEPLSAVIAHKNGERRREIEDILSKRAKLPSDEILEISEPQIYFTSPGGIDEQVESFLVEIKNWNGVPHEIENYTDFSSAGFVRELDALQVLRPSHVGGMFDARLEINVYRLLQKLNRSAGAWIGAAINPARQKSNAEIAGIEQLSPEKFAAFDFSDSTENNFLQLERKEFAEIDSKNNCIAKTEFEYVSAKNFSKNTVAAIPFFMTETDVFVGVEFRDLPAPQNFTRSSRIACVPAWRLPFSVEHKFDLEPFLQKAFPADFGVSIGKFSELGGSYFTSAGITPEIVYPAAVELDSLNISTTDLKFFRLQNLLDNSHLIPDAHFLILLNRLGHALGFLSK
jgi:SAM-dependent methyltransferase